MPRPPRPGPRPGSILPLLVICLIALMGMIALAVDVGMVAVARTQAQDVADLAALAGARMLNGDASNASNLNNVVTAVATAKSAAGNNAVLGRPVTAGMVATQTGIYAYDAANQRFTASFPSSPGSNAWSVMAVTVNTTAPTYFGRVLNIQSFNIAAKATAAHRPRDVALILDFSGSMKFGTQSAFFTGDYNDLEGSLNPDDVYPKFGHYYDMSQRPLAANSTQPTGNGTGYNPMRRTIWFEDSGGETHAANNLTATADGGPPVIQDFVTVYNGSRVSAFYQPQASWATTNLPVCTPAPDNFQDQSDSPVTYAGDKWPRKNGKTSGNQWAATVLEYTNGSNSPNFPDNHQKNDGIAGGAAAWEGTGANYGYGKNFKGYSMGPGYYGKTFWMWPPDPRWGGGTQAPDPSQVSPNNPRKDVYGNYICDWRKRFFCYPQANGNPDYSRPLDDNSRLFDSSGYIRQPGSGTYAVNYKAILTWLKSGPQVLPPNLHAGRLLYYDAIPSDIPVTGGDMNQCFWRDYIKAVLGIDGYAGGRTFYGKEPAGWGTVKITPKANLYNGGSGNSAPYMMYLDSPIRPRAHFWFGPLTMCMFLTTDNFGRDNMWPGTCHESHCWQLKAAINSALDDIKNNHPNDWASLIFFSTEPEFATPRVTLGRDYPRMRNALFFPFSLLDSLGDSSQEIRPYQYNSGWNMISYTGGGDVPNARGGTCPHMAFMAAYNQFSTANGYSGRRGATKLVIFETDGVPNAYCDGAFQSNGPYKSVYTGSIGSTHGVGNNSPSATDPAVNAVSQICAMDNAPNPGYSTSRNRARVHAIAFGDLFETSNPTRTAALSFLLRVQQAGLTSTPSDTSIESYKIITGDYNTRIANLRQALERIMQSGIQVSLIQ